MIIHKVKFNTNFNRMKKLSLFLFFILMFSFQVSSQNFDQKPVKVFLLAGQSNMDGCGVGEELPEKYRITPKNVNLWDNKLKTWVELGETSFSNARNHQFGPEMEFSHRMSKAYPDHNIRIIKTSGGGTKLFNQWIPEGGMYRRFNINIRNALHNLDSINQIYEICGMLWMQGESDSETFEMASAYEENLKIFFYAIREEMNVPELPIVMSRISSCLLKETPWVFDQTPIVQKAQEAVADTDPNVLIINTDKLSTLWDNTHFDTKAQLKLGGKMAKLMLKALKSH